GQPVVPVDDPEGALVVSAPERNEGRQRRRDARRLVAAGEELLLRDARMRAHLGPEHVAQVQAHGAGILEGSSGRREAPRHARGLRDAPFRRRHGCYARAVALPFSHRLAWDRPENALARAERARRARGEAVLDLTVSNPTRVGLP